MVCLSKFIICSKTTTKLSFLESCSVMLATVLTAKSDSDVMFVYKVIRDSESIDHLCINHIRRI